MPMVAHMNGDVSAKNQPTLTRSPLPVKTWYRTDWREDKIRIRNKYLANNKVAPVRSSRVIINHTTTTNHGWKVVLWLHKKKTNQLTDEWWLIITHTLAMTSFSQCPQLNLLKIVDTVVNVPTSEYPIVYFNILVALFYVSVSTGKILCTATNTLNAKHTQKRWPPESCDEMECRLVCWVKLAGCLNTNERIRTSQNVKVPEISRCLTRPLHYRHCYLFGISSSRE